MTRTRLGLVLSSTLALLMTTALLAGPHARRGGHGMDGEDGRRGEHDDSRGTQMVEHLASKLDLTEAQRGQLEEIVTRYHEGELQESRQAGEESRRQLAAVVHDPAASEQQVIDAAAAVSTRAQQTALTQHRMIVEIDRILTEEQREKARELRTKREQRRAGGNRPFTGED